MIKELEEYRDYLQYQKNYSLYTVENYCSDIVQFLDYLNSESINFKSLQYSDLRFYLMYLKDEKGENNSSIDVKFTFHTDSSSSNRKTSSMVIPKNFAMLCARKIEGL